MFLLTAPAPECSCWPLPLSLVLAGHSCCSPFLLAAPAPAALSGWPLLLPLVLAECLPDLVLPRSHSFTLTYAQPHSTTTFHSRSHPFPPSSARACWTSGLGLAGPCCTSPPRSYARALAVAAPLVRFFLRSFVLVCGHPRSLGLGPVTNVQCTCCHNQYLKFYLPYFLYDLYIINFLSI
jgi:hypothetical protein